MSNQATIQPGDSDQCAVRRPGATTGLGSGRLPCVLQVGHDGDHLDAFNRSFTNPDTDERAAWFVASSDRPDHDPPAEVHMLANVDALRDWASERGVRVHLVSTHPDGRHIYAAHSGRESRVAKGPPRGRTWETHGFQT